MLSWKFLTLDKDGDGYLNRAEYKELRRLAKKAVRPKKCARTFARTCDLNRDLKLSKQEWGACLVNDFTCKFNTYCMRLPSAFSDDNDNDDGNDGGGGGDGDGDDDDDNGDGDGGGR